MNCPRCQQENPPQTKFCLECATPLKAVSPGGRPAPSYSDVTNALSEALEQQTATAEILRVISRSATTYEPVFEAIVRSASTLCRAPDVIILMLEEGGLRAVASIGPVAAAVRQSQLLDGVALPLTREYVSGRAFIDRRTVHIEDVSAMPDEFPVGTALQRQYGGRGTTLSVPLLRDDTALGVITLVRDEVSPFSEQQITLLGTLARQAVIAIENVRRFKETTEALEQQTATAEVLRVLSSSPTNVQPVMQTIVDSVIRLADADDAMIGRAEGDQIRWLAAAGTQPGPLQPISRSLPSGRAILDRRTSQVNDISVYGDEFPAVAAAYRKGVRTILATPLLREGDSVGVVLVRRTTVRPFTDQQIGLLKTFADQAVIALENVRLFTELQEKNRALTQAHAQVTEALEQQTATSEILRVISASPTDLQPVFETIVANATRLCRGRFGTVHRFDGTLVHLAAHYNLTVDAVEALQARYPQPLGGEGLPALAIRHAKVMHVADVKAEPVPSGTLRMAHILGYRSQIVVPMLRTGIPVGALSIAREEIGLFPEAQVELLKTFANQAVIAIENVRLFTELQEKNKALTQANAQVTEALEQQTATSEILRVISTSPTDVQPVFKAIARSAVRLSGGVHGGVLRLSDDVLSVVAYENLSSTSADLLLSFYPTLLDRAGLVGLAIRDRTSFIRQMSSAIRGQLILSSPGVRAIRASWPFRSCALASRSELFS
jgi:two-component system, NtrC family, sensor kinase